MAKKSAKSQTINQRRLVIYLIFFVIIVAITAFVVYSAREQTVDNQTNQAKSEVNVPSFLLSSFPETDWSRADPAIDKALSGGPSKDGIPAIDNPKFEPVASFSNPDSVQAIVVTDDNETKVYPYNILVWHEIVNDEINGKPISVTFCPLCGSAAVYEGTVAEQESTFGVSGGLIESNMIMYDRASETLWQQSTGKALAGKNYPGELTRLKFQLISMGDAKDKHPNAQVLSSDTGHSRNYDRNPYSGYDDSNEFIFSPSKNDTRYPAKTIFAAFKVGDRAVAAPWLKLQNDQTYQVQVDNENIELKKEANELTITDGSGQQIPFYFEMWFSWAVQNQDNSQVFDPEK